MNIMQLAPRMTADEYLAQPEDGIPTWLVEGEVVVNAPWLPHQDVLTELTCALRLWTKGQRGRGHATLSLDSKLDERNVFGPDLQWYAEGHIPGFTEKAPHPLPDLAVEVRSPSTWRYDVGAKMLAYERAGLTELWLVDTISRAILVFRRSSPASMTFDVAIEIGIHEDITSPQLPGFALPVASLFAG
jgi:Uma2 family endonuclease